MGIERITEQQFLSIIDRIGREILSDVNIEIRPQPKIRPYTAVEAAAHLGRWFVHRTMGECGFVVLGKNGINQSAAEDKWRLAFKEFAEQCTWADTGEPCGVKE